KLVKGENHFQVDFPSNLLNEGEYYIHLISSIHFKKWIFEPNLNSPKIQINIQGGLSESDFWISKRAGILAPIFKYEKI
ncbi:MAG: hypothetical protein ACK4IX_15425, partial [Candidatus Sericytochromatia bacterium]